ncbi:hypothetical protein COT42_00090 [Candidatus Saganbacteria bacterium CG08_land_8_20_14_0_20_45_16]|uniref:Porin domain-containing protein n=1 Tax=Candidatus Saganbacteria bacterium CG08_land_8_20_14_0_20_45_16 TaxID=2014293 RepID=A0A2H0Y1Z0_UNCSA|nr:MAG: hypothetical protein COT42_00090 [Candidatus Saganbacteria bacterium CG08_land_8_20_14_0_20_45_16]
MTFLIFNLTLVLGVSALAFDFGSSPVITTIGTDAEKSTALSSQIGDLSLGFIKVGSKEVTNLSWRPNFKLGVLGLGLDINYALGEEKPNGYENIVLRYVEYDDGSRGLRYGIIESLTWGHGLLIKNYTNWLAGLILLNNDQLALLGYATLQERYVVRGLWSKTGVMGLRLEEKVNPMLKLGQTYIVDNDGVMLSGTTEVQKVAGVGLDATVPLPLNFEAFAEWAQLVGHGSGFSTGLSWAYDLLVADASFLAAYRMLDNGFVPGYFGQDYETNPINLTSAEATGNIKNGYVTQLGINALGLAALKVAYENYNDSDSASVMADLFAKLPQDVEVTGYYKQPNFTNFRSLSLEQGAIMGGSIAYPVNPYTRVVVHYKKIYNPDTASVEESQYYELRFSF